MGRLASVKCPKCGLNTSIRLGAGMMFFDPEVVLSLFEKDLQEKIRPLITGPNRKSFDATFELGICTSCKKAASVPVIKIMDDTGNNSVYKPTCSCGNEFKIYDTNSFDGKAAVPCPLCKSTLNIETLGLWD
jgi:hypothetical protein